MGSWYRSFALRGNCREEVVSCLDTWHRSKGFERQTQAELFLLPPDEKAERGAFVLSNADWTVVCYSHFDEEDRLELELVRLNRPVMRFFVVDSDVWAYQLRSGDEIVSAFASRHGLWDDLPDGPNDLERFCRALDLEVEPSALRRLQKQRAIMAELSAHRFLSALGVEPAATQFDYLRANEFEFPGYDVQELRYRRPDFEPMLGFDLHRITPREATAVDEEDEAEIQRSISVPPHVRFLIAVSRVIFFLLRPLLWLLAVSFRLRNRNALAPGGHSLAESAPGWRSVVRDGWLEIPPLGFKLALPEGAEPRSGLVLYRWNGLDVSVAVEAPTLVRSIFAANPPGVIRETRDHVIDSMPARSVVTTSQTTKGQLLRSVAVYIASARGIYVLKGHATQLDRQPSEETTRKLIDLLSKFELAEVVRPFTSLQKT